MIRRLSMKGRAKRSASIAVPMGHRMFDDSHLHEENSDDDDNARNDRHHDNNDADDDNDDDDHYDDDENVHNRRRSDKTSSAKSGRGASSLARSKSERHYQSTGNVRAWTESDLQDLSAESWQRYYLRCFSVTPKGVVSRGDYIRYRRVGRSQSVVAPAAAVATANRSSPAGIGDRLLVSTPNPVEAVDRSMATAAAAAARLLTVPDGGVDGGASTSTASSSTTSIFGIEEFVVYVVGSTGVGKSALTHQFTTSEHILNSKDKGGTDDQAVTISLNGEESRLIFRELKSGAVVEELKSIHDPLPCAFLVVYSVTQMDSFVVATHILNQLHQDKLHEDKVVVLVGNKSELVRSRVVNSDEGHSVASRYKVKFIETSVGINYNVDELVVGVLTNLRVALQKRTRRAGSRASAWPNRLSRARSSLRRMFDRVFQRGGNGNGDGDGGGNKDGHRRKRSQSTVEIVNTPTN